MPPTPSDPARLYLLVSQGDLSAADEERLKAYPHPYIVVLGLPETLSGAWLNGDREVRTVIDLVLEHRPLSGVRPHVAPITELRYQVMRLPGSVNELARGIPLIRPLRYIGGTLPEAKYSSPETLTCTVRFEAYWRMKRS